MLSVAVIISRCGVSNAWKRLSFEVRREDSLKHKLKKYFWGKSSGLVTPRLNSPAPNEQTAH